MYSKLSHALNVLFPLEAIEMAVIVKGCRTHAAGVRQLNTTIDILSALSDPQPYRGRALPGARRPPGAFIRQRSRIGHAMRTLDEPLRALFAWHGVLESDLAMPLDDH